MHEAKHPTGEKPLYFWCLSFTEITFSKQRTLKISLQEPDSITLKKQYSRWMMNTTAKYEQDLDSRFCGAVMISEALCTNTYLYTHTTHYGITADTYVSLESKQASMLFAGKKKYKL